MLIFEFGLLAFLPLQSKIKNLQLLSPVSPVVNDFVVFPFSGTDQFSSTPLPDGVIPKPRVFSSGRGIPRALPKLSLHQTRLRRRMHEPKLLGRKRTPQRIPQAYPPLV